MRLLEIFTFLFVTLAIAAPAVDNTNAAVDSTNNMGGGPDHHRCRYGYDECLWRCDREGHHEGERWCRGRCWDDFCHHH